GPQVHSQFNLWRWEQVIGRELMWCAPLPRDGRQGAAPEPARLPFGGPRHPQIRLRSRIGFIVRVNSVRDIGAWCQRASGDRRRQMCAPFLFSTAPLENLFFKHSPPRLAEPCFCAWELFEDGEANPFEWRAPASHCLQFRSRQLSAGLNGDREFLIAGGVQ